jgi:RNA polymerase sigma-70 factor (ECF subfamily)
MPTDPELLARIAARDRAAFATFYDRYAARAFGLVLQLLQNRADAEDVLQDVFLQVWVQAGRFDPARASAEGWVLLLARSRAIDRLRRIRPAAGRPLPEPAAPNAGDPAEAKEEAGRATAALDRLPAEQRVPIRLAFFAGLTHDQIARRLNVPLGTVKTRIRLGMIRLRERVGREAEVSRR